MKEKEIKKKLTQLSEDGIGDWKSSNDRITTLNKIKIDLTRNKERNEFRDLLRLLKALDHQSRIEILFLIKHGVSCACELEYILDLKQPTISHHLGLLEDSGLIKRLKKGKWSILEMDTNRLNFLFQEII